MKHWILTRTDTTDKVLLAEDLQWIDEYDWSAVAQSSPVRTLSGAIIMQRGIKTAGRNITLSGDWVWQTKADIDKLRAWTDEPDIPLKLTHPDGREFTVAFRTHENAMKAEPVVYRSIEQATDQYTVTLNLITL